MAQIGEEFYITWGKGEQAYPAGSLQEARNLMALYRGLGRDAVRFIRGVITSYDDFITKGIK